MSPSWLGCSTIYVHYQKNQGVWQSHVCHVALCMGYPIAGEVPRASVEAPWTPASLVPGSNPAPRAARSGSSGAAARAKASNGWGGSLPSGVGGGGVGWHPVATGLAGQAIPFIVAASHAHALPSAPFWFSVPAVPVASPASLCPSSLSAVPALVPPGVAPAFCVSVSLLPVSGGAPGCPHRAPPPVPPACPPIRGFHISIQRGLPRARLAVHGPVATPVAGTSRSAGHSPRPCGVRGHLVEGGGVFADGSLGVRCIWWLLQCSHLMVPLCLVVCPVGARLPAVCRAALCPAVLLHAFLPVSGSFFFCWPAHCFRSAAPGG